jgi:hypothetical protein
MFSRRVHRTGQEIWSFVLGVVAAACEPNLELRTTEQFVVDRSVVRTSEEFPLEISEKYPTFAGYYCAEGDLVVGVTAQASDADVASIAALVRAKGVPFYCHHRAIPNHEPTIVTATKQYSFLELRAWRDSIRSDFFATDGALGIAMDYAKNRIVLRVEQGYEDQQRANMATHGVADAAVDIVAGERAKPRVGCLNSQYYTSPTGCFRPAIPGGVQLKATIPGSSTAEGECTLGIAGRHLGFSEDGWVTAGHCFNPTLRGQVGATAYQFTNDGDQRIGWETIDSGGTVCGSYHCIHSDAAWIRRDGTSNGTGAVGQIIQTFSSIFVSNACAIPVSASCTINTASPRFQVYGTTSVSAVQGMQIDKVGRTTGWTTGIITYTSSDEPDNWGNIIEDSVFTSIPIQGGDSGSPVFYWWSFYDVHTVQLLGVMWAGNDYSTWSLFSPWSQVAADLGNIDVKFAPTWAQETSVTANDVGVGANGHVWIISNIPYTGPGGGYYIQRRLPNGTWDNPNGGTAVRIAVDPSGNAWVVNGLQQIWKWTGSAWSQLPGTARDIGIGANGSVWIIGTTPDGYGSYSIGVWNGSSWTVIDGAAVRISVDPAGNPWVIAHDNTIYRRVGGTWGTWQQMPGLATDIGIAGDGMVWVLGTALASTGGGYEIFWWSGIDWQKVFGGGISISGERGGKPWEVTNINTLWKGL